MWRAAILLSLPGTCNDHQPQHNRKTPFRPLTFQFVLGASSLEQGQVADNILQRHLEQQWIEEGGLPANQSNVSWQGRTKKQSQWVCYYYSGQEKLRGGTKGKTNKTPDDRIILLRQRT